MLKLKKTAKETAAALNRYCYQLKWRVASRTYEMRGSFGHLIINAKDGTAEAECIQKENELVAEFPNLFSCIEDAAQEIASAASETVQDAAEEISEGEETAESGNAPQGGAEACNEDASGLTISLPLDGFTDAALENLRKLVKAKEPLICKALDADCTVIIANEKEGCVKFPWWSRMPSPEETQAYIAFIAAISALAKNAKRVNAANKREVESERYAFRGFLLRLGFIGPGCAAQRKILLNRLSGSASFPSTDKYNAFCSSQKAKRDAGKDVEK